MNMPKLPSYVEAMIPESNDLLEETPERQAASSAKKPKETQNQERNHKC